ncbi:hypothetical protein FA13DRAFT_1732077 [Coprinellus micaceus]|uniref:Uncharacterized protein n=1 Tax=Coprinellus micaceus TaxID=71717 RepID=A0A4Y7TC86_COPMI|nr:hypothetical protein FA13DRAFT_1732077 [Coprinellus micaceus]
MGSLDHDKGNGGNDGGGGGVGVWLEYVGLNSGNRSYADAIVEPSRYRRWKMSTLQRTRISINSLGITVQIEKVSAPFRSPLSFP